MGYVPPSQPSATELIRRDLSPMLTHLFITFGMWGLGRLSQPRGLPRSYEEYRRQLYGEPGHDWFPVLNFMLLACGLALPVTIAVAIIT